MVRYLPPADPLHNGDIIDGEIVDESIAPRRRGFVGQIAVGLASIFWVIRNPGKAALRGFGAFCGLCGTVAVVGGVAHLIAGQPGTSQFNGFDPLAAGKVGADLIRPVVVRGARAVDDTLNSTVQTVDGDRPSESPQQANYRR